MDIPKFSVAQFKRNPLTCSSLFLLAILPATSAAFELGAVLHVVGAMKKSTILCPAIARHCVLLLGENKIEVLDILTGFGVVYFFGFPFALIASFQSQSQTRLAK